MSDPYDADLDPDGEDEDGGARSGMGSRRWWTIGLLILVPALALLTWVGVQNSRDAVTPHVLAYHVVDDRTVTVDVEVEKPHDWSVTCDVSALDGRFATVGSLSAPMGGAGHDTVRRTVTVRTASRAVTGTVKVCSRS